MSNVKLFGVEWGQENASRKNIVHKMPYNVKCYNVTMSDSSHTLGPGRVLM